MTTRLTLAALGVLAAAGCASAPAVSPAEAEALLAEYFGTWTLAETVEAPGPPAFPVPRREQVRVTTTAENRDRVMRQVERDIQDDMNRRNATQRAYELANRLPDTVFIGMKQGLLFYDRANPRRYELLLRLDGGRTTLESGERRVGRAHLVWHGSNPQVGYAIDPGARIWLTNEITADGRLRITQTMQSPFGTSPPVVGIYVRLRVTQPSREP